MDVRLLIQAIVKFLLGLLIVTLLLFVSAGTFDYPKSWLFITILFVPMFITGIILWIRNPDLLAKRLNAKEKEEEQKHVIILSGLMFIAGFVIAGLDFRFSWSNIPGWLVVVAIVVFLLAYILYGEVLRENTHLSRTIGVEKGQKVIDTGLYAVIRHPMYLASILLFLSIPLILGSFYSFLVFLIYPALIVRRILNEEKVLEENLPGYVEYKEKVKYRLIKYIW